MTLSAFTDKFVSEKEGNTYGFPDGSYVGECLSLVKLFIQEFYGIYPPASGCNGARCYWSLFPNPLRTVLKKVPNTPDLIPEKGWIVVWNKNAGAGYGHIAIILDADINSFTSFDQNYYGKHAHKQNHNYANVEGFLAPIKDVSSTDENMTDNLKPVLDYYNVKDSEELTRMVDEQISFLKGEREKTGRLTEELDKLKADNATYKSEAASRKQELDKFIEELAKRMFLPASSDKSDITAGVDRLLTVEDQLSTAKKSLIQEEKKHELEKSEMQKEIDELKVTLEEQADTNKKLLGRVEDLEKRLSNNESASDVTTRWKLFIESLIKLFGKDK